MGPAGTCEHDPCPACTCRSCPQLYHIGVLFGLDLHPASTLSAVWGGNGCSRHESMSHSASLGRNMTVKCEIFPAATDSRYIRAVSTGSCASPVHLYPDDPAWVLLSPLPPLLLLLLHLPLPNSLLSLSASIYLCICSATFVRFRTGSQDFWVLSCLFLGRNEQAAASVSLPVK